jgi:hypothetical protein
MQTEDIEIFLKAINMAQNIKQFKPLDGIFC